MTDPHEGDAHDGGGDRRGTAVAPHRLTLSATELALVFRSIDAAVPEGFANEVADAELPAAGTALLERGVVAAADDGRLTPVASVAANVATLTAPVASVQVEVNIYGAGLRSRYAVQGPFGASLITLPQGAAELSFFPAEMLGRELIRAVPAADTTVESKLARALDGLDATPAAPLSGYCRWPRSPTMARRGPWMRSMGPGTSPPSWGSAHRRRCWRGRWPTVPTGC